MNENVLLCLDRAESAINDADLLLREERVLAVANRAYYAVFYCVNALLASCNVYTKKHSAVRSKFSELFVKTKLFDLEASRIVGNCFASRQSADYDMQAFISVDEAALLLHDARHFQQLTLAYFREHSIA